jgi:hypothetical protein
MSGSEPRCALAVPGTSRRQTTVSKCHGLVPVATLTI